jgi:hypothetical protein
MAESFQATATGLYSSHGMIPCAVKYWLVASRDRLKLTADARLTRRPMSEGDIEQVSSLDRLILGFSRAADHRWWLQTMRGFVYTADGCTVGYAYLDDGWISPALAVDEPTLVGLFSDLAQIVDKEELETAIFGTSRTLFRALIESGFRIGSSKYPTVYASNEGALPPSYILHADWLP